MKKVMMSSLLIAAAVLFSCEKEEVKTNVESSSDVTENKNDQNSSKDMNDDSSAYEKAGPGVSISAKPYRPIKIRPRDMEPCDCYKCFGVCEVKVSVDFELNWFENSDNDGDIFDEEGFTPLIIDNVGGNPDESMKRVYFPRNLENSGELFFVDEEIYVEKEGENFKILEGSYSYHVENGTVLAQVHGESIEVEYVAYVDVNYANL